MFVLVLPDDFASWIHEQGGEWGVVELRRAKHEGAAVVVGATRKLDSGAYRDRKRMRDGLRLWSESTEAGEGLWYQAEPELHEVFDGIARRDGAVPIDLFKDRIKGGWRHSGDGTLLLTVVGGAPPSMRWRAWLMLRGQAQPVSLAVQAPESDILTPIADQWPFDRLVGKRVVVIGLGSIGAASAQSLLAYGARELTLVDDDHLLSHNFARHRMDREHLGRRKVSAVADVLRARDPLAQIQAQPLDILYDADLLRPILLRASGVLVATDGVASRRVANHLACWARIPAVFACELGDGAYGELVRYRPYSAGCLWCLRETLIEEGSMDPEPAIDRGYGTGSAHLPTTGVGPDLWIVGELAAKLMTATLLEESGLADQRAPGNHALIGLRPRPDYSPPFDFTGAARIQWHSGAPPRADCPSCGEGAEVGPR